MQRMAFGASLSAKAKALEEAKDKAEAEALRKKTLFEIVGDVTPIHKMLSGDIAPRPEDLKKAFVDIDEEVRKAMQKLGVDPQVSTFYTLSGLYTLISTKKNSPLQVAHLFNEYTANEAMRRGWYKGASVLASEALGRPATPKEVERFVLNYGTNITGSRAIAQRLWVEMTGEPTQKKPAK
jgi:transcriptional regulator of met regulon